VSATQPTAIAHAVDPDQPLQIPAPAGHPPLRARRVLQLLRNLRSTDDQVAAGLELFDAVGGVGGERTFQRFLALPRAHGLLRSRPDLVSQLGDRTRLAALPTGSLGRAYLDFAQKNGFAADGLVEKNKEVRRDRPANDPYRQWFWDRFTVAHDLWHVVTGCEATPEGEANLLAFSFAQTPQRGYLLLLGLVALGAGTDASAHRQHWRAWRAGRRAVALVGVAWEELLACPLEDVRRELGVDEL
jgi:ubiquinone biosynthesis protein COQ4